MRTPHRTGIRAQLRAHLLARAGSRELLPNSMSGKPGVAQL
ncbi:hypothetical protein ACRAKI_22055 [Saccharothrix isguenensis]